MKYDMVKLLSKLAAGVCPVGLQKSKLWLHMFFEKLRFKVREDAVAPKGIVSCGEAAAGDRGNAVHLVQQSVLLSLRAHRRACEFLQHPIRQRGGARATAGKGEHQEQIGGIRWRGSVLKTITGPLVRRNQ